MDSRQPGPDGYGDGQQRPRQYFPGEQDRQPQPYSAPQETSYGVDPGYAEEPAARRGNNTPVIALGVLLALALLGAVVLFFLWRGAAEEANQPPPPPVTETVTSTTQETVSPEPATVTETETGFPGQDLLSSELPSEVPNLDVESWLNDLLGDEPQPAPAQ